MRISNHICTLAIVTLFTNCANDSDTYINDDVHVDINGVAISAEDFTYENVTRADYSISETEGLVFNWSEGDTVGIYPVGGDQVAFPISEGEGSKTAQFDGGSWALRANKSYSAYYPFSKNNYLVSETRIPVNYAGQVQDGNGSLSHIQPYDYMACAATTPDKNGYINLQMKHLGCLVRFQITLPDIGGYTNVTISSNNEIFTKHGYIDLSSATPSITSSENTKSINIELRNASITEDNKVLTVYTMLSPKDYRGETFTVTVYGANSDIYKATIDGKNMIAGKAYNYNINITQKAIMYSIVDLGLSVKWATFNIGATKPEERGALFAWGETNPKGSFSLSNYKWYDMTSHFYIKYGNDNKTVLDLEDDAANIICGDGWRLPTKAEAEELLYNCNWTWTTVNGVNGYEVKSKTNDNYIFLPVTYSSNNDGNIDTGAYWLSTLSTSSTNNAYFLYIKSYLKDWLSLSRDKGYAIRPVYYK